MLIVGEEALHREIGGPEILRAQREQIKLLANLPHIYVQIIPFDAGAHASHGATFTIVTLIEGRPCIVYVEGLTAADYLGCEHVRVYNLAFETLFGSSLSRHRTIERINLRIKELT